MSRSEQKASRGKPITQHQLFPALVALWFGALFGLGSLALRGSLIEALVVRSRIDLLIPAAAPPLGMTARILIALVLAALGAMVGSLVAQRLARPGRRERERGATSLATHEESMVEPAPAAEATAAPPPPDKDDAPARETGFLANRRRSLAIEPDQTGFVPHEAAPLPGGAPQILAVAKRQAAQPGLEDLGIEDLSARLVESMRRRSAARAESAPEPATQPAGDVPADQPAAVPPFEVPPFAVPPFTVQAEPEPAEALADPEALDEAEIAEEDYASLLGVKPSPAVLRNPFMRPEEPTTAASPAEPVVIFPGQTPPAASDAEPASEAPDPPEPAETERALRSALANLRQMRGAG